MNSMNVRRVTAAMLTAVLLVAPPAVAEETCTIDEVSARGYCPHDADGHEAERQAIFREAREARLAEAMVWWRAWRFTRAVQS